MLHICLTHRQFGSCIFPWFHQMGQRVLLLHPHLLFATTFQWIAYSPLLNETNFVSNSNKSLNQCRLILRTWWLCRLNLCRSASIGKCELIMKGFLSCLCICCWPIRNKGTTSMNAGMLVSNDRYVLEWTKRIKRRENIFFAHCFGHLYHQKDNSEVKHRSSYQQRFPIHD